MIMNKNKDVIILRNQNIILKLIEELLEKASNKITAEYRKAQLESTRSELATAEIELANFRNSLKGQVYIDEVAKWYTNVRKKNIGDVLIPAHKAELALLEEQKSIKETALETYN